MPLNAKSISDKSNACRDKIMTYNNTMVKSLNQLFLAYGLPAGCTENQLGQLINLNLVPEQIALLQTPFDQTKVDILPTASLAAILNATSPVIGAIGKEVSERTFEADIEAMGYADLAALVADLPNQLGGGNITAAQNVFEKTAELLSLAESLISVNGLNLAAICQIKNKVAEIAPTLTAIG